MVQNCYPLSPAWERQQKRMDASSTGGKKLNIECGSVERNRMNLGPYLYQDIYQGSEAFPSVNWESTVNAEDLLQLYVPQH